jgi:hypothetical protein
LRIEEDLIQVNWCTLQGQNIIGGEVVGGATKRKEVVEHGRETKKGVYIKQYKDHIHSISKLTVFL